MRPTPRSIAETFRPHRHVVDAPMPRANGASKLRPVTEARDWDSPETREKYEKHRKLSGEHDAVQRQLDTIHGHIGTMVQEFPSKVRDWLHPANGSGSLAADGETALAASHEKALSALPDAAKPPARLLLGQLVKHAHFLHTMAHEVTGPAAKAAHDDLFGSKG